MTQKPITAPKMSESRRFLILMRCIKLQYTIRAGVIVLKNIFSFDILP